MSATILQLPSRLRPRTLAQWAGAAAFSLVLVLPAGAEPATPGAPPEPHSIEAVLQLASEDRHEAAVQLFERVKQQRPDTIASIHGHKVAVVYAVIGDRERHEAHCRWLMERYRDAELPTDAERSVKGYLLFPSADDPALIEHALERTRLATDYAVERGEGDLLPWFEGSRGMAEYRSANFAEAVAYLEKAATADNLYISSLALPFQAMAEFERGNHQRAAALLEQARAAAARLPAPGSEEYLREWTDTLTTKHALREAERVVEEKGPAPK
jgi:tetratricopeptide (TPR) repeat protein